MRLVFPDIVRLIVVFIRGGIRALLGDCQDLDPSPDPPKPPAP